MSRPPRPEDVGPAVVYMVLGGMLGWCVIIATVLGIRELIRFIFGI